ncbi:MAG TPA: hypothetical protein VGH94_04005 [Acidimicrobiales bacterium]|jgi:hypothetical protein
MPTSDVHIELIPRPVAGSVDELIEGSTERRPFFPDDARSSSRFEWVTIGGERFVLKHVHLDDDFTMRVSGDLGCRPLRVWRAGLMDVASDIVDHGVVAMAAGDGRNGWGAALLLRDLEDELVAADDSLLPEDQHLSFLDHCAGMAARFWGWHDDLGLLAYPARWAWFGHAALAGERELGFPEAVPRIAGEGWERFVERAPRRLAPVVDELRHNPRPLAEALQTTPSTFLHGDWKLGNLGTTRDGRTLLIDWAYPGEGPVCHELLWYLALNRSRLPAGHTKESSIEAFRAALTAHGIPTDDWWDRQLGLCQLGALVQFGWEKALGDEDELRWWCERAEAGTEWL